MKFSVVTPSFRQLDWLRLCIASVADQNRDNPSLQIEHIVQDAGSDGVEAFAGEMAKIYPDSATYSLRIVSEKDEGMYDALNRGFQRASGDILSYLNCDEQYLPGALARVGEFFTGHPEIESAFADTVVVHPDGSYLCYRKGLAPQVAHTLVSENLSFCTAAAFSRREVFQTRNLYYDKKWRSAGDAIWALSLCKAGVRMANMPFFTSTFTDTGENLNFLPQGVREKKAMRESAPAWMRLLRPLVIAHYRLRKALAGAYSPQKAPYEIFTLGNASQRARFEVENPTFRWQGR